MFIVGSVVVALESIVSGEMFITDRAIVLALLRVVFGLHMVG